jgi:transposase
LKELYAASKKRRGRSKYFVSVAVSIQNNTGERMNARIVYVRDRAKRKNWIAFLCTDMELSEEQIIELYGKRWSIEVFLRPVNPT